METMWMWHGIRLTLPEEWNLSRYQGTARRGAIVFSDLRGPRLLVRWRAPGRIFRKPPPQALADAKRSLARRSDLKIEELAPNAFLCLGPSPQLSLIADDWRLYELEWRSPDRAADFPRATTIHLGQELPRWMAEPEWFWLVYGAQCFSPAWATLKEASLMPGRAKLVLQTRQNRIAFGSHALADRLLEGQTLRQWAVREFPQLQAVDQDHWRGGGGCVACRFVAKSFLRAPRQHLFEFWHLPKDNRIRWTHFTEPTKTP